MKKLIAAAALLAAMPALAQTDFLKAGKDALGNLGASAPSSSSSKSNLSDGEIGGGLKEALSVGAQRAVSTVSKPGGFLNDPQIHIPLPGPLEKVKQGLGAVGMSGMADDLEKRINKAAEDAAPKATQIFVDAIKGMSLSDVRGILSGPKDSATQYFKKTTSGQLDAAMKPIVDKSLSDVGAVKSLNEYTAQAKSLPFASGLNVDLTGYVTQKAMDGIFLYLGKEEADIRTNPAARTTDLLKKVFG
jgi:hypothetical protein